MIKHTIIMAGGAGKRLWPASVNEKPKQFMSLDGKTSLLQGTVLRAVNLKADGQIIIVTHKDHVSLAVNDCAAFAEEIRKRIVILPEPIARNTAPALLLAATYLKKENEEDSTILVLAADHIISTPEPFQKSVEEAGILGDRGYLVPFGIKPLSPETGYGYIEAGPEENPGRDVISFKEKPDEKTAEMFIQAGNYYWNSGMFVYKISVFWNEMLKYTPEVINPFISLLDHTFHYSRTDSINVLELDHVISSTYENLTPISVDYALMEKSPARKMVSAEFSWNDVGSWDVISEITENSRPSVQVNADGNFIYSDIPVGISGVNDLIVVIKNGRALICRKGDSQSVKEISVEMPTN